MAGIPFSIICRHFCARRQVLIGDISRYDQSLECVSGRHHVVRFAANVTYETGRIRARPRVASVMRAVNVGKFSLGSSNTPTNP